MAPSPVIPTNLPESVSVQALRGIPGVNITDNELSPLLAEAYVARSFVQAVQSDPQGFIVSYAKKVVLAVLDPAIAILPPIEEDVDINRRVSPLKDLFVEVCILLKHSFPRFLAHMQEHSIVLAPIISTGHLGTVPLAATTVATMISNVTGYGVISGLTGALDHVLDPGSPASLFTGFWCICTSFVLLVTFIPMTMMWSSIERLLVSLRQSPDMVQLTMLNLHLTALSIPAFAAYEVLKRYLNSKGLGSVHTRLTTLAATLNATLNYVLVHGPSSVRLGFPGAPIATAACYNFVAVSTALYILLRPCAIQIQAVTTEMNKPDKPSMLRGLGVVMFLGLGGVARTAATSWSKDVIGFSTSVLGPVSLATQAVLIATTSSAYQVPSAIGECSQRRLEHLLSTGCVGRAKLAIVAASLVTVGAALGMCNILYWYCDSWSRIITNDPEVNKNVQVMLPLINLYIVAQGLGVCVDHLLRVFNKLAVYPALTLSTDYFGGIPLGLLLTFSENWGLSGLWAGLTASLACSFFFALSVLVRCDWP